LGIKKVEVNKKIRGNIGNSTFTIIIITIEISRIEKSPYLKEYP